MVRVVTGLVATSCETPRLKSVGSAPAPHLNATIYRSEAGAVVGTSAPVGTGSSNSSSDMLAVAIRIEVDDSVRNLKVRLCR